MRGEYRDGRIRHTARGMSSRPPYITRVTVEYDVMPDLGLVDGRTYEFDLFNGRAIVRLPDAGPRPRRARGGRTLP